MTTDQPLALVPGTLAAAVDEKTRCALETGALQPIETEQTLVEDGGVPFLVRAVSSLARKDEERSRLAADSAGRGRPENPFLPPDPDLTVAEVSPTHLAVLNKFNVIERHLLVVTRGFEHQETLLTEGDFRALFTCMAELGGLGFYNGGAVAGASQEHKHLQLVPLFPLAGGRGIPMERLFGGSGPRCPGLPFAHAFGRLGASIPAAPGEAAAEAHRLYRELLALLGIGESRREGERRQSAPYNLLIAGDWMLAVPRRSERFGSVSVNALGFAGSLFVRDQAELAMIRSAGPMRVLAAVAGPAG